MRATEAFYAQCNQTIIKHIGGGDDYICSAESD